MENKPKIQKEHRLDIEIIKKPWGYELVELIPLFDGRVFKTIVVFQSNRLSLQSHKNREEYWEVAHGECLITIDDTTIRAFPGVEVHIPREIKHRIEAVTNTVIKERGYGQYDPLDIIRYEDDYDRVDKCL